MSEELNQPGASDDEAPITDPRADAADVDAGQAPGAAEEVPKLDLTVQIESIAACRKRVVVTISAAEIAREFAKEYRELSTTAQIPGFRPGKTPRKLIERRYQRDIAPQVRSNLLMRSIEQVGDEHKLEPLSQPSMDIESMGLPGEGDFTYEFEIDVRPEFDLPDYAGLKLTRPKYVVSAALVDRSVEMFRQRLGQLVDKDGPADVGDVIVGDIRFLWGDKVLNEAGGVSLRVEKDLYFQDAKVAGFADIAKGATPGDSREMKVEISEGAAAEALRGKQLDAVLIVQEVKQQELAPVEKVVEAFNCADLGELRDYLQSMTERKMAQSADAALRDQVCQQLLAKVQFDLPAELVRSQAETAMRRELLSLKDQGLDEETIKARLSAKRHELHRSTVAELREQFILQAIAEKEDIDVGQEDQDAEIERIAAATDESVRKVRQQIERQNLWDVVLMRCRERKTVDRVIALATVEEVEKPLDDERHDAASANVSAAPEEAVAAAQESEPAEG